ncbi:MAG: energy-coupled thiamine transporter ThiT [Clostridia bacterium]|nr:energy-coupled thiamine transporter ThiT [Clostridia bacterium]
MWDFLRTTYMEVEDPYEEYYLVDLDRVIDKTSSFMLYVTVALLAAVLISWLVIKLKNAERLPFFSKIATGIAVGYSLSVIAVLGYINIVYCIIDGKITDNFWIVVSLLAFLLVSTVVAVILNAKKKSAFKPFVIAVGTVFLIGLLAMLAFIPAKKEKYEPLNIYGMYVFSAVVVAVIVSLAIIFGRNEKQESSRSIAYASVCISLSFALSYVKFFTLGPNGGSITFASLLPLMIFAYKFGTRKGVLAGVVYGLLQFIQSPQFYQPMQVILDYPVAFGAIGLAGMFKNVKSFENDLWKFISGAVVAVLLRYAAHVISGYYIFYSWAWEGYGPLAYSVIYNLFCFVDLAIVLVPAVTIFSNRPLVKKLFGENT